MKVSVTEYEKQYTFELQSVTQLCGQSIVKKTYILESIRRYFSSYRYREEQNRWRNNIKIDDNDIGRKYFDVVSVNGTSELLTMVKWSKQSLLMEYVKYLIQKYDLQLHLRIIDEELEKMFQIMNEDIKNLGNIELTYASSDIWEMVQKTDINSSDQIMLDEKSNCELMMIFLNLIEKIMHIAPKRMVILIENIDHLCSIHEYMEILDKMQKIGMENDVYFVVTTSMDGYVKCNRELCEGITIFGDVDFQMPQYEIIKDYIYRNYPCNHKLNDEQIQCTLEKIMQRIGQNNFLHSIEENVICKLINQSLMLFEKWTDTGNALEIAFLSD